MSKLEKLEDLYVCQKCGYETSKQVEKCPKCGGEMVKIVVVRR